MLGSSITIFMLGYSSVFDVYGPQLCGKNKQKDLGKLLVKVLIQGFVACLMCLVAIFCNGILL